MEDSGANSVKKQVNLYTIQLCTVDAIRLKSCRFRFYHCISRKQNAGSTRKFLRRFTLTNGFIFTILMNNKILTFLLIPRPLTNRGGGERLPPEPQIWRPNWTIWRPQCTNKEQSNEFYGPYFLFFQKNFQPCLLSMNIISFTFF